MFEGGGVGHQGGHITKHDRGMYGRTDILMEMVFHGWGIHPVLA